MDENNVTAPNRSPRIIAFGEFTLDIPLRRLCKNGTGIPLAPKPFHTLVYLIDQRDRVVSKTELLSAVWGERREVNTVEQAVREIRRALDDSKDAAQFVATVPGFGYRFIGELISHTSDNLGPARSPEPVRNRAASDLLSLRRGSFALAILLILASSFVWVVVRFRHSSVPARITVGENDITAWDARQRVIWHYTFDHRVSTPRSGEDKWRTQIMDLDGDGSPEVLFAATTIDQPTGTGEERLYCFSAQGKLRWKYQPSIKVRFNAKDLDGPWRFGQMLVLPNGQKRSVWIVVDHAIRWSAFLIKLSPEGAAELQFVDSGIIYALQAVSTPRGGFILAGGVNNEYRSASLAVLRTDGPPSTSPQSKGAKEECIEGCPAGRPYRYLLFPPTEINRASLLPYNSTDAIDAIAGRGATIQVTELEKPCTIDSFYELSDSMEPKTVFLGDNYDNVHREFERDGRLNHSLEKCHERRKPLLVRMWAEQGDWQTVEVGWGR
jgi:DNA-binding winged helix-turn-helix (wHTH) protein